MATPPTVIYPLTLLQLLHHIITTQTSSLSTLLIICSSKDAFLQTLMNAIQQQQQQQQQQQEAQDEYQAKLLQLATPTLDNLFTARHVNVTFCPSVQSLMAYLTSLNRSAAPGIDKALGCGREANTNPRMVLVNPLGLHSTTPSLSAQGLSRTFAAAVESSARIRAHLVVAECYGGCLHPPLAHESEDEEDGDRREQHGDNAISEAVEDLWELDVSILNVSAKKFGSGAGDRAWAGRTVKAKRIAARWFRFHKLDP